LEKWVTLTRVGHTQKKVSHLEKLVRLEKMGYTWKKELTLGKMVYTLLMLATHEKHRQQYMWGKGSGMKYSNRPVSLTEY